MQSVTYVNHYAYLITGCVTVSKGQGHYLTSPDATPIRGKHMPKVSEKSVG